MCRDWLCGQFPHHQRDIPRVLCPTLPRHTLPHPRSHSTTSHSTTSHSTTSHSTTSLCHITLCHISLLIRTSFLQFYNLPTNIISTVFDCSPLVLSLILHFTFPFSQRRSDTKAFVSNNAPHPPEAGIFKEYITEKYIQRLYYWKSIIIFKWKVYSKSILLKSIFREYITEKYIQGVYNWKSIFKEYITEKVKSKNILLKSI